MRRLLLALAVAALTLAAVTMASSAETLHEVSVGNYTFIHDDPEARARACAKNPPPEGQPCPLLTVTQGDRIRFTIRAPANPPHTVNIDELGEDSGPMQLFETWTTKPITKTGTFKLYCVPHRDRGHETTLTVVPAASSSKAPIAKATSTTKPGSGPGSPTSQPTTVAGGDDQPVAQDDEGAKKRKRKVNQPAATVDAPESGRGVADDRWKAPPNPNSVEALTGRDWSTGGPWTKAFKMSAAAALPIFGLAAFALARQRRRERLGLGLADETRVFEALGSHGGDSDEPAGERPDHTQPLVLDPTPEAPEAAGKSAASPSRRAAGSSTGNGTTCPRRPTAVGATRAKQERATSVTKRPAKSAGSRTTAGPTGRNRPAKATTKTPAKTATTTPAKTTAPTPAKATATTKEG